MRSSQNSQIHTLFNDIINKLEKIFKTNASYDTVFELFRALKVPFNPTAEELSCLYHVMYAYLDFKNDVKDHIRYCALGMILRTLYDY